MKESNTATKDPICGMNVDGGQAPLLPWETTARCQEGMIRPSE